MKKAYVAIAGVLGFASMALSQTACHFWFHQPKEPKCLKQ